MTYYILIKRKGKKGYLCAAEVKPGVSLAQAKRIARKTRPGYVGKVISSAAFQKRRRSAMKSVRRVRKGKKTRVKRRR